MQVDLLAGERWWGGAVSDGQAMPFGLAPHRRDLATNAGLVDAPEHGANQSAPLLLSNRGRYVWSENPFSFEFAAGVLRLEGVEIDVHQVDGGLDAAFHAASAAHFPASGRTPAEAMFTGPQYNTWIEMPYWPTQEAVLTYVRDLLDAGFPPGLVMIDDRWSTAYGTWRFDFARFPDPAAMVDQLHAWGCTVMLWLVPFVSADSDVFRQLRARRLLLTQADGEPVVREWWNGFSAILDVTNPDGVAWLQSELDALVDDYGVDGFKFDAGDLRHYRDDDVSAIGATPTDHCEAWAKLGVRYAFNEYRACWKMGGQPLAQRLHDKPATWGADGLLSLIPESIAQGLIGHPFNCPDMVGGGELGFAAGHPDIDQELFVRYAQCAALFPMIQFSMSPKRALDDLHFGAVMAAVALHQQLVPEILDLARAAATTGEPIVRPLAFHVAGYDDVKDQFMIGANILAAPVLERGAMKRRVVLPPGEWVLAGGSDEAQPVFTGPATIDLDVTLTSIPWFRRRSTG
ncbi:MAG: glycoside hydrolase family 31 protein [Micropruina sp.]